MGAVAHDSGLVYAPGCCVLFVSYADDDVQRRSVLQHFSGLAIAHFSDSMHHFCQLDNGFGSPPGEGPTALSPCKGWLHCSPFPSVPDAGFPWAGQA